MEKEIELIQRYVPMSETMFYILLSLREERHGYGIMQHVKTLTQGRIALGAGTIYQTLHKLDQSHMISATREAERKKFYHITEAGETVLQAEIIRIRELYHNIEGLK
ncbi:DNA-binding PadR family transcriptional regulator [Paenibacillus shirakamiensis]|uniref:DNA-binding PadR family transcriptional regulator n=1 Tax=Paenibacillus shirakamiensis TaxID=1265935 RepID=A0ABS4JGC7_9BACL|nr:helix-turn-helix transcriptional regulator [Paenibacillus shirakamiensis]MBP2000767.1 DNA-binding PadR family transcriptional regulator [Paenibacillus shirakamiensis]